MKKFTKNKVSSEWNFRQKRNSVQKYKFLLKIANLGKDRIFRVKIQKFKFSGKYLTIELFDINRNFGQKLPFSLKTDILVKQINLW